MSDWISANDRLPEEGKNVFIEFEYEWGCMPKMQLYYYDVGRYYKGEWRGGDYYNNGKNHRVRYWMDIPPVPEQEGE